MGKRRREQRIFPWGLRSHLEPLGLLLHMGQKESIGKQRRTTAKPEGLCGVQAEDRDSWEARRGRPDSSVRYRVVRN